MRLNFDFIDMIMPSEILYDLGACEGRFSIYAYFKGLLVIAFELETKNCAGFTQNIKLNKIEEAAVKSVNIGVGAKNGKALSILVNLGRAEKRLWKMVKYEMT